MNHKDMYNDAQREINRLHTIIWQSRDKYDDMVKAKVDLDRFVNELGLRERFVVWKVAQRMEDK